MQYGSFFRNVLTMAGGTVLAQLIPIAAAPLLSRLYTPAEFGLLATIVGLGAVLSVLSTGRYELAIVLPSEEADAQTLVKLTVTLASAVCLAAAILLVLSAAWLDKLVTVRQLGLWIYAVPPLALFIAIGQIGNSYANRHRAYRRIAAASVWQQLAAAVTGVLIGVLKYSAAGLVIGRLVGMLAYIFSFRPTFRAALSGVSLVHFRQNVKRIAWTYRQFPAFNMPYSVLGSLSRDLLIFAFVFFNQITAAGLIGLARMVLSAPVYFLSSSISQVFYKEAAEHADTDAFQHLSYRLLIATACALIPAFSLLSWWAPDVFAVVFSERWREAGNFAAALAVPAALSVLTGWPERMFEVRAKQHWALIIQFTFDVLSVLAVLFILSGGMTPLAAVQAFAVVQSAYHLTYLAAFFKLARLAAGQYLVLLGIVAMLAAAAWLIGYAVVAIGVGQVLEFAMHTTLVGILSLLAAYLALRNMMFRASI